ncbi:hypothetical protein P153DRAFT_365039 [Dothidotthia symphoricarpi CBS 119687]|uniref:Uncharacterized protein n=1 Tax=Dothidotthia symphoricarpi CBS 119687 TaxID=1392245 RepID=A0A6A6AJP6_9PLEO|nr:uncharacterized protein P153DRAFT_365039 [Dothidotthia symphoricarpi CBS 119687]KAF2131453.1 hypothetical protein P153DRAFT_365039 [Dothidotthia symphoricarpi CBS 119687]
MLGTLAFAPRPAITSLGHSLWAIPGLLEAGQVELAWRRQPDLIISRSCSPTHRAAGGTSQFVTRGKAQDGPSAAVI